jgi:hypothetical protein
MHFDSGTAEDPRVYVFRYFDQSEECELSMMIPHRISSILNSADFEEIRLMIAAWRREIFNNMVSSAISGHLHPALIKRNLDPVLRIKVGMEIYNKFIVAQARIGNDVWQAPTSLVKVSIPPEEDERYNDGHGRLV